MKQRSAISTEISEKTLSKRNYEISGESIQRHYYERRAWLSQWQEISMMLMKY